MSIIIVVMPKVEDAKKIRRILVNHGFTDTIFCPTGAGALMEINKYTSGLVVSGYRLSDMYYRELSENLPKYFDMLLIGSAAVVSDNPSGLMSLTTPLKVISNRFSIHTISVCSFHPNIHMNSDSIISYICCNCF